MNYVLATSRPWNEVLSSRLEVKTGHTFQLITRKEELTEERLRGIEPRYIFFPHWSHIIPASIHSNYECVIFHMTDLPYGRGGSPLQNLIQRGHQETQISALRCVAELDAGPIYMKRRLCLGGAASEIFLRAAGIIESMIEDIIRLEPVPQQQQGEITTFRRRTPDESDLARAQISNLNGFFDFIRMLDADGYPKAFIQYGGYRYEFSRANIYDGRIVADVEITKIEEESR